MQTWRERREEQLEAESRMVGVGFTPLFPAFVWEKLIEMEERIEKIEERHERSLVIDPATIIAKYLGSLENV